MAELKAPRPSPSPTHAGTAAGVLVIGFFGGVRAFYPEFPEMPEVTVAAITLAASFVGGVLGRLLRKKGLI